MPIYLMECTVCEIREDRLISQSDKDSQLEDDIYPSVKCNSCGAIMRKTKTLYAPNFDFKGDNWTSKGGRY